MKIGILTHYYESRNYGGLLQAYALVTYLRDQGYDAEQICYKFKCNKSYYEILKNGENKLDDKPLVIVDSKEKKEKNTRFFKRVIRSAHYRLFVKPKEKRNFKRFAIRDKIIKSFRDYYIPHSIEVFDETDIADSNFVYDCFITGSDQVWNFNWFNSAFFLEFADEEKKKIAYSASAGKSEFEEYEKDYLKRMLPRFDSISVREADLTDQFSKISGKEVKNTLDPVFLLDKNEWDMISNEIIVNGKYIFVYLLGPTDEQAKICNELSKKLHLRIVYIPHAASNFYSKEPEIKGKKINKIGPREFISLIKNATYVLTDSFHATAFSVIFNKSFYTFPRNRMESSNSRIKTLVKMIKCEERFEDKEFCASRIIELLKMPLKKSINCLLSTRELSKQFLSGTLNKYKGW